MSASALALQLSPKLLNKVSSFGCTPQLRVRLCFYPWTGCWHEQWLHNLCNGTFNKILENGRLMEIVTLIRENYKRFSHPTEYWDNLTFRLLVSQFFEDWSIKLYTEAHVVEAVLIMKTFFHALFIDPETLDFDDACETFVNSIVSITDYADTIPI
jgi:hypothetical protein